MAMRVTLAQALGRAGLTWNNSVSHVDAEQAYLDRTVLAAEVRRLGDEVAEMEREMSEAEAEIRDLSLQVSMIEDL